jgi:hypothetical protein
VYTPISNKPHQGKPFTLQHLHYNISFLQHLLFGDFAIVIFLFFYNAMLRVRRAASTDLWQACEYRFTK